METRPEGECGAEPPPNMYSMLRDQCVTRSHLAEKTERIIIALADDDDGDDDKEADDDDEGDTVMITMMMMWRS